MAIKLAIFDLDGTLANTLPDITRSTELFFEKYGHPAVTEQMVRESIGNGAKKLLQRIARRVGMSMDIVDDAELARYKVIYRENGCVMTKLYPSTMGVLEELKRRGVLMAVATMKPKVVTEPTLKKLGINGFFDVTYSAEDMQHPKPDPWVVLDCAKRLGIAPAETAMVGDGLTDVGAGNAAGAVSIGVLGGYFDQEKLRGGGADYYIDGIGGLIEVIDRENGNG